MPNDYEMSTVFDPNIHVRVAMEKINDVQILKIIRDKGYNLFKHNGAVVYIDRKKGVLYHLRSNGQPLYANCLDEYPVDLC